MCFCSRSHVNNYLLPTKHTSAYLFRFLTGIKFGFVHPLLFVAPHARITSLEGQLLQAVRKDKSSSRRHLRHLRHLIFFCILRSNIGRLAQRRFTPQREKYWKLYLHQSTVLIILEALSRTLKGFQFACVCSNPNSRSAPLHANGSPLPSYRIQHPCSLGKNHMYCYASAQWYTLFRKCSTSSHSQTSPDFF